MNNKKILHLAQGAMIAAIYAAATYLSAVFGVAYGGIQFRLSEALTVLSLFTPAAIPGLTVGCIIGNIASPLGIWDILLGSAATLLSSLCARNLRNIKIGSLPLLSFIMPVIFNAIIIGGEISVLMPSGKSGFTVFLISALQVGAGELTVCILGGIPLYYALRNANIFR